MERAISKNNSSKIKVLLMVLFALVFICNCNTNTVKAGQLQKNLDHTFAFAVPEGGYSSVIVHVDYKEIFSLTNTNKTKYYRRELYMQYKCAYATSKPDARINFVSHTDKSGNEVYRFKWKEWQFLPVYVPRDLDGYTALYNETVRIYYRNKVYYALVSVNASCNGALVPVKGTTLKMTI